MKIAPKHYLVFSIFALINGLCVPLFANAAPVTHSMGSTTEWNLRLDGPANTGGLGTRLSSNNIVMADINNDGTDDLITTAPGADLNGSDAGSVYIIDGNVINAASGTGNTLDLTNTTNFILRIDGFAATTTQLGLTPIGVGDVDGDDRPDLAFASSIASNSASQAGSIYILYNTLLDDYTGTGNVINLSVSSAYNVRIDGSGVSNRIGQGSVVLSDINDDGKDDVITGSINQDDIFILYSTLLDPLSGTGNTLSLASSSNYTFWINGDTTDFLSLNNIRFRSVDYDGDDKLDLAVFSPSEDRNSRTDSGSTYLFYNTLFDDYTGTGNLISIASSTYNVRIEGSSAAELLGEDLVLSDLTGDGDTDFILGALSTDNVRSNAGAIYVLNGDTIRAISGTGNSFDLATASNYILRIDGAAASDNLVTGYLDAMDFDNDGTTDLAMTAQRAANFAGGLFVLPHAIFASSLSGTGTTLDLSSVMESYLRYDGAAANDNMHSQIAIEDINEDGLLDIVMGAFGADNNSRTDSGSIYVIYNFPHEQELIDSFEGTGGGAFTLMGTTTATGSVTNIAGVQWSDDNDPQGTWASCTGTFDSTVEQFSCSLSPLSADGAIYIRSYDTNNVYTPETGYTSRSLTVASPISAIAASAVSETGATITWTTDADATTQVEYGETSVYGLTTAQTDLGGATSHSVPLTSLSSCTEYHYQVASTDLSGNSATSSDQTFTTGGCSSDEEESDSSSGRGGSSHRRSTDPSPEVANIPTIAPIPSIGSPTQPSSEACFINPTEYVFLSDLKVGMTREDVLHLQQILNTDTRTQLTTGNVFGALGHETSFFGTLTFDAVKRFQSLCSSEILVPLNLSAPTGFVGPASRKILNTK